MDRPMDPVTWAPYYYKSSQSSLKTSMQIWILGMLVEHELNIKVPPFFPTRNDADTVSYIMRKENFDEQLFSNADSIRRFGEVNLKNTVDGQDFFLKMKRFCRENALKPGYIPL
ncbi:unnamed protein product [Caenorhabditis brenneri]